MKIFGLTVGKKQKCEYISNFGGHVCDLDAVHVCADCGLHLCRLSHSYAWVGGTNSRERVGAYERAPKYCPDCYQSHTPRLWD